jgi:hypothetical protein
MGKGLVMPQQNYSEPVERQRRCNFATDDKMLEIIAG